MAAPGGSSSQSREVTAISLNRLLPQLEQKLLSRSPNQRPCSSGVERAKLGANLEYARTLLFRLEHESAEVKIQSRRQNVQADLQAKRNLIKRLSQQFLELNQQDDSSDEATASEDDDDDDGQLFPSYAPARNDTSAGLDVRSNPLEEPTTDLKSTLRSRRPPKESLDAGEGMVSGDALLTGSQHRNDTKSKTTEAVLSDNRSEQEAITTSLLSMAQALKSQSLQFGTSLELDKSLLGKATEGLGKSSTSMDSASQRMGTLRRMTEGRGWWGRMLMYAWIAGLWVLAFLIVFALPKLRF